MKLVDSTWAKSASVSIDGQVYNAIQRGLLLLVGVGPEGHQRFGLCGPQVSQMRIFSDEEDKMNSFGQRYPRETYRSLTIYPFADTKKGKLSQL